MKNMYTSQYTRMKLVKETSSEQYCGSVTANPYHKIKDYRWKNKIFHVLKNWLLFFLIPQKSFEILREAFTLAIQKELPVAEFIDP
jgi:hypothetical protein